MECPGPSVCLTPSPPQCVCVSLSFCLCKTNKSFKNCPEIPFMLYWSIFQQGRETKETWIFKIFNFLILETEPNSSSATCRLPVIFKFDLEGRDRLTCLLIYFPNTHHILGQATSGQAKAKGKGTRPSRVAGAQLPERINKGRCQGLQ